MRRTECQEFLAWALPKLGFRPAGFHLVRGQVCKRIARRMRALALTNHDQYRHRLDIDPEEWRRLDSFCRITISRFFRDRPVFNWLEQVGFPDLAAAAAAEGRNILSFWSAGCGSGEEPYSLRILWDLRLSDRFPALKLAIIATDADSVVLDRARRATYSAGCLREVPRPWIDRAFHKNDGEYCLRENFRHGIQFVQQDIRQEVPVGPFDLVLCRNLAFTYFHEAVQGSLLTRISRGMKDGGILIIGRNETLPSGVDGFEMEQGTPGTFRLVKHRPQATRRTS